VTTDADGYYFMENTYPMTQWLVMEAYNDLFYTTGVTYQTDNQPTPTTILGAGVDINVLPIIGLGGRLDWGVHAYDPIGVPSYADSVLADGPSHYYRLGESAGTTAADEIGTSDGTYGSSVTPGATGLIANDSDTAAGFNGTADSYVDTNETSLTDDAFSVEAWVNANLGSYTGQHRIAAKDEQATPGVFILWLNNGDLQLYVRNTAGAWVIASAPAGTTPPAGQTFHVAGVFDGTNVILYVDGVAVASALLGTATTNKSTYTDGLPVTIGADSDPTNGRVHNFNGTIDEVAIYEHALTANRIQAHYASASAAPAVDPQNGGIVGTVSYDTTRAELDPRYAGAEDWQPSIPGLTVNLWSPVRCGTHVGAPCSTGPGLSYELEPDGGAFAKGQLLNSVITEQWVRPSGCVARDVDGNPLVHGVDENVLPLAPDAECLEGPLQGVQFGNDYAAVDGNYGFGDGCFGVGGMVNGACADGNDPTALPGGLDYLVEVVIPTEADVWGDAAVDPDRPLYKVTREEDINVGEGDDFIPAVPPPACAGSLHTVDVFGFEDDEYPEFVGNGSNGVPLGVTVPPSESTVNDSFADIGDVIYEGLQKPLCDTKLVPLHNGSSIAPTFFLFTDVPLPGRAWGLIVDDLNFAADPTKLLLGEKAGVPFAPVGIYDYTNNHVTTVESDYNGLFDVLLPSTNRINCPTPSGVCANMFRFVGNDPGTPGRLNLNYKPQFRTISADFEVFPGLIVPADLAPTQVGVVVQLASGQFNDVSCTVDPLTPQIFAVDRPYGLPGDSLTITGQGFGDTQGTGTVNFDGLPLPGDWTVLWSSDTTITVTLPNTTPLQQNYGTIAAGPHQLSITNSGGQTTVNGLTYHYLRNDGGSNAYNPNLYEVGPTTNTNYSVAKENAGTWFVEVESLLPATASHAIQAALDAATASPGAGYDLVVVYPGVPTPENQQLNPRGAYYENLIITSPVKLQGVGPGSPDGSVPGSIIDGLAFGGDSPVFVDWWTKIIDLTWDGNQNINDGAVISIFAQDGWFNAGFAASIDGFDLRGGNQQGFPGNINQAGGLPTGLPANLTTQGGAIFANGYARYLQITNNTVQNNGGAYGTIRIGTPDLPAPDNQNDNVRIANNRIFANGGTNLAGGIGLFAGADNYEVAGNDICGNFSAEYGGGISHYGLSPNGVIHDNRIYFNSSYDEGGGVMIAGALPTDPLADYNAPNGPQGSGPVDIYNNLIQANLANDDGGGLRFLMAGNFPMNVYNNMIVNNVSTHEGGGISLNDAPNVRVYNNTIMKNLTTATAITSNGQPAPAGLSTSQNSDQLLGALPIDAPVVSDPLLFNNIFWDNRAGTWNGLAVTGLSAGDADRWDLGVANLSYLLAPTNSVIQQLPGVGVRNYTDDASNSHLDPAVVIPYDLSVAFNVWRNNPNFVGAVLVAVDLPPELLGDYHLLNATSPAFDLGVPIKNRVNAPVFDIDGDGRPGGLEFDSGADELIGGQALPIVTGVNATPNPTAGATSVILAATGNSVTDIIAAEWFTGTVPGIANAVAMTVGGPGPLWSLSAAIDISSWSTGNYTLTVRAQNETGWSPVATTILQVTAAPAPTLYFSTVSNIEVPGLAGPFDDADIYSWNGLNYARVFDASDAGLPGGANIDALSVVDADTFYMSFTAPVMGYDDSDIVLYDAGAWSLYFYGSNVGLTTNNEDVDAFEILPDGSVIVSTTGNGNVPVVGGFNDEDLLRFTPTSTGANTAGSWELYFDGSDVALSTGSENVNGVSVSAGNIYLSTTGNFSAAVPNQQLSGLSMDVFSCNGPTIGPASNCDSFSMYFNGIVNGILTTLDAIDLP